MKPRPLDYPLPPLDALIVLGARLHPQGGPGRVARLRLLHALHLWRHHYPQIPILITGGRQPGGAASEARVMAQWSLTWVGENWGPAFQEKLRPCLILEEASRNTRASAANTLPLLAPNLQCRVVGLVSDTLHMPRARFLFARHFRPRSIGVHPLPARGLLRHYWQHRRYWWLGKMALREGGAWLKVLVQQSFRLGRRPR
jgi:uncharacterized SAM-binding protein YcdF (DUF218 family)